MNLKNIFRKKVIAKKSWLGNVKTFFEKYRLPILIYQIIFSIYFNYTINADDQTWKIKDNLIYWSFIDVMPYLIILLINIINEIKGENIIGTKYLNIFC